MGQFTTTVWKGTYAYLMGGSEADDWLLKIGKYEPNLPQLGNANCIVETNRPAQCMLVEIARSLVNTDYGDVFTGLFQGAGELRVKETDRIKSMQENLAKMGAKIKVARSGKAENIVIEGVEKLRGAKIKSFGDHRTAMSMAVAGLLAGGKTRIDDGSCINKSFPGFLSILRSLREKSYH